LLVLTQFSISKVIYFGKCEYSHVLDDLSTGELLFAVMSFHLFDFDISKE